MDTPEIILNLWYVCDAMGVIYSIRARVYIVSGTDSEKLAFLKEYAVKDYLIARPFPIPKHLYVNGQPIFLKSVYDSISSMHIELFKEAIETLQNELPDQTPFDIPDQPLICITPLMRDDSGNISPIITGEEFL